MQYRFELLEAVAPDDAELKLTFSWPLFFRPGMRVTFPTATVIVAESAYTQSMPFVLKVVPLKSTINAEEIGVIEVDDTARMMKHLGVVRSFKEVFAKHVSNYELCNPGTLEEAAGYLAELDALDNFVSEQGTDENLFLEKAGSLQWSKGGKSQSSQGRRIELRSMLKDCIVADRFVGQSMCGTTPVIKGFRK